ncbi:MAG: VWA domain-containing protein [Bryobacteraceae bacterium]
MEFPACLLLFLLTQAAPQEVVIHSHAYTPPASILRAETNLVEAPLTVRDSQGRAIPGLHAADFEVYDNGVVQKITAFSEIRSDAKVAAPAPPASSEEVPAAAIPPPAPKFVTFFFDDAHLNNGGMMFAVRGAHGFIAKGLKPPDRMSIVTTSGQGDLDFTDDQKVFAEKLDHLASHIRPAVAFGCGAVGPDESYIIFQNLDYQTKENAIDMAKSCACGPADKENVCYPKAKAAAEGSAESSWDQTQAQSVATIDALGFAAKKLHEQNGARILVLTSAGFLIGPGQPEMKKFVDAAVRWNIVVHAIDALGLTPIRGNTEGRIAGLIQSNSWMPLQKVAEGTGGHFFKNSNDLAAAMELAAHPEVTYLVAFNPGPRDGKFHTLKIRFKSKRPDAVQFRPGYYSPAELKIEPSARTLMDDAVFSNETLSDVPAAVRVAVENAAVTITIVVDVNHLEFASGNGRHGQQIVFLTTLLDANGAFVTGKEAMMELMLTDGRLASFGKDGLKAVVTLNAAPGAYQVRTIVREAMKGRLTASTIPVALTAK